MDQAITVAAVSCLAASFQMVIYQTNLEEASSYRVAHSAAAAVAASVVAAVDVAVAKSGDVVVEGIYQMEEVAS